MTKRHRRTRSHIRHPLRVTSALCAVAAFAAPAAHEVRAHSSVGEPPYGVGVTRCTLVDHTRDVLNYANSPPSLLARQRTLVTDIRYPTLASSSPNTESANTPPSERRGGFPLVVFAHGYDVTPGTYATLLDTWSREGFVVAAPIFPDENSTEVERQHVNTEADLVNEPADLAFVIRQLIGDSATLSATCPLVNGLIRPSDVALAGHSDGAEAVGLLAYSTGRDPQGISYARLRQGLAIRATMIFSGAEDGDSPYRSAPSRPPLLVVQSARDQCNAPAEGLELYGAIHQSDKWFLELLDAHHLPPFDGEDRGAFDVVAATTTAFLQYSLDHTRTVASMDSIANARPLVGRFSHAGSGPVIAPFLDPPPCGFH
jgi:hypothetical protein